MRIWHIVKYYIHCIIGAKDRRSWSAETIQIKASITKQELCLYLQIAYLNPCKLGTCCRVLDLYNITL